MADAATWVSVPAAAVAVLFVLSRLDRRPSVWLPALACLVLCLAVYPQGNTFSYHFHADEITKIEQAGGGGRNFNHPLLMIESVRAVVTLLPGEESRHGIVMAGRAVAAWFMAGASALLVWALAMARSPAAGWVAVPLFVLHPPAFEYAHYFKEDPALVFGMALLAAALLAAARNRATPPSVRDLAAVGVAAGLAASGKYIGLAAALAGMVLVVGVYRSDRRTAARAAVVLPVAALLTVLLVNAAAVADVGAASAAITAEVEKAEVDGNLLGGDRGDYLRDMVEPRRERLFPLVVVYLAGWFLPCLRRSRRAGELFLPAFTILYLTLLLLAGKNADRYLLPCLMTGTWMAVAGFVDIARLIANRVPAAPWRPAVTAGLVLVLYAIALPEHVRGLGDRFARLTDDSGRLEMIAFIRESLPADSRIVYGLRVGLPDPAYPEQYGGDPAFRLGQEVVFARRLGAYGGLDGLRAAGFTHVVVTGKAMETWPDRDHRMGALFADLKDNAKLIFRTDPDEGAFQMPLLLYEIPPGGPEPAPADGGG